MFEHVPTGLLLSQQTQLQYYKRKRILCLIYTHSNAHDRIEAIFTRGEGGRCDGFVAFSHATVPTLNAIALQQPGGESYANMWQKIRAMWKYVYEHYADEYEYFHICGEDVYVVVDNSRACVSSNNEMTRLQEVEPVCKRGTPETAVEIGTRGPARFAVGHAASGL